MTDLGVGVLFCVLRSVFCVLLSQQLCLNKDSQVVIIPLIPFISKKNQPFFEDQRFELVHQTPLFLCTLNRFVL